MHSGEKSLTGKEGVSLLFTAILHLSHCSLCRAVLLNARNDAKVSSAPLCSDKHAECVRIQKHDSVLPFSEDSPRQVC